MRRNSRLRGSLALLAGVLLTTLAACTPSAESPVLLHRYAEVDAADWQATDTVWFDLPAVENPTRVCATLSVRALQSYPYRNLSLRAFVSQKGRKTHSRRADFRLFDTEGTATRHSLTFAEAQQSIDTLRLLPHQHARIGVVHIMRQPDLQGVSHVGIKLTRLDAPARP